MAKQTKKNIGNVMIITPNREKNKVTSHPFVKTAEVEKLKSNYWGASKVEYKSFVIDNEITQYCPNKPNSYGMMTFVVDENDVKSQTVQNIGTEAFDESKLQDEGQFYRFVLEGYYIWRKDNSEYSADGFGYMRDDNGMATHILATFGKRTDNNGNEWIHLILQVGNIKAGEKSPSIITEFTGGGGSPPGSGCPIPPPIG